ncbi:MAG: tetratricopeptide repeat protein [Parabacteroides sp.]
MLLFFCLISLLQTGCRHRPAMDFAAIEALLPSRPDSVVALLKPVNPERFVTADKAHYYLLLAEAEERQGKLPSSDKSILLAAQYFNAYGDDYRYARALYLQGRIYEEWRIYDKAVFCWVKALDYAERKGDQSLLYRLSIHIGHRYAFQEDTDHALRCYQSALRYAEATADSAAIAFSQVFIGRVYEQNEDWHEANRSYSAAYAIAKEAQAWDALQASLLGRIMILNDWFVFHQADRLIQQLQTMPSLRKDADLQCLDPSELGAHHVCSDYLLCAGEGESGEDGICLSGRGLRGAAA